MVSESPDPTELAALMKDMPSELRDELNSPGGSPVAPSAKKDSPKLPPPPSPKKEEKTKEPTKPPPPPLTKEPVKESPIVASEPVPQVVAKQPEPPSPVKVAADIKPMEVNKLENIPPKAPEPELKTTPTTSDKKPEEMRKVSKKSIKLRLTPSRVLSLMRSDKEKGKNSKDEGEKKVDGKDSDKKKEKAVEIKTDKKSDEKEVKKKLGEKDEKDKPENPSNGKESSKNGEKKDSEKDKDQEKNPEKPLPKDAKKDKEKPPPIDPKKEAKEKEKAREKEIKKAMERQKQLEKEQRKASIKSKKSKTKKDMNLDGMKGSEQNVTDGAAIPPSPVPPVVSPNAENAKEIKPGAEATTPAPEGELEKDDATPPPALPVLPDETEIYGERKAGEEQRPTLTPTEVLKQNVQAAVKPTKELEEEEEEKQREGEKEREATKEQEAKKAVAERNESDKEEKEGERPTRRSRSKTPTFDHLCRLNRENENTWWGKFLFFVELIRGGPLPKTCKKIKKDLAFSDSISGSTLDRLIIEYVHLVVSTAIELLNKRYSEQEKDDEGEEEGEEKESNE